MNPATFLLFSMSVASLALLAVLSIAWASFGRPRHALFWAAAYAAGAVQWLLALLFLQGWATGPGVRLLVLVLGAVWTTLVTIGFRQRAGLRPHVREFALLLGVAAALMCWAAFAARGGATDRVVLPTVMSFTGLLSAATLVGRSWDSNLTERATFCALMLANLYYVSLALFAIVVPHPTPAQMDMFRVMQMLGTPSSYIVTGLFSVFLLAADLAERMRRLAILDPLTGVLNRRGLEQAAEQAIANSRRIGQPLSVVLADLDRFKQINDTRGHAAGDRALKHFSTHVERAIRKGDLFGRVGGEEFALVLTGAGAAEAAEVAERIRLGLSELDAGADALRLTCSFGVAELGTMDAGFGEVAGRADTALYRSKVGGRNQVTLAEPEVSEEPESPKQLPSPPTARVAAPAVEADRRRAPRLRSRRR